MYVDWDVKHLYVAGGLTRRSRDFHNKGGNATGNAPGTALVVAFKEERCDRDHNEEVRNDGDDGSLLRMIPLDDVVISLNIHSGKKGGGCR